MRVLAMIVLVLAVPWNVGTALAAASNACKQCQDQQRACTANYPGKTCKTEYDICMKSCRGK